MYYVSAHDNPLFMKFDMNRTWQFIVVFFSGLNYTLLNSMILPKNTPEETEYV